MIITSNTQSVARGLENIVLATYVSLPKSEYPLLNAATKINLREYRNTSDIFSMLKLEKIRLTPELLTPGNVGSGGDNRNIDYSLSQIRITQSLYPATITLDISMTDQSIIAHSQIAQKLLGIYALDLREVKIGNMLLTSATNYNCSKGSNKLSPTECTVSDLGIISSLLRSSCMVPILSSYLSSIGINSSGVPKSYMLVASNTAISEILNSIDAYNLKSFIPSYQYAGASNYSHSVRGVECASGICLVSSSNFNPITGPNYNRAIIFSGDSYVSANTVTQEKILLRDSLVCSPTGLKSQISIRGVVAAAVTRSEGVYEMCFSNK